MTARMERQKVLSRPDPPMYHAVMGEGVLRQLIGFAEVMAEQLDRLIKAAETPGIVLQVLPYGVGDHPAVEGPIELFESAAGVVVGYTEMFAGTASP